MEYKNITLYTIGYSSHSTESFIAALKQFEITAIADVRSQPYSRFKPEFNRENLKKSLAGNHVEYVFLGDYIGARIKAPECYRDGQADYGLIAKHPLFQEGIDRLLNGMKKFRIAMMCAEKDPINCHRTILICRELKKYEIRICHIIDSNTCEDHPDAELRLMKLYHLEHPQLFMKDSERLEEAYLRQSEKIAYVADDMDQYGHE